jgi:hypothetical protein
MKKSPITENKCFSLSGLIWVEVCQQIKYTEKAHGAHLACTPAAPLRTLADQRGRIDKPPQRHPPLLLRRRSLCIYSPLEPTSLIRSYSLISLTNKLVEAIVEPTQL